MSLEKQTFRSGPYKDLIAQGVRVGNMLHLSGQVGTGSDGARAATYGGIPEVAQTLVQVVALVDPALKIEIKCTAQF